MSIFCPNCKKFYPEGKYCPYCGFKQQEESGKDSKELNSSDKTMFGEAKPISQTEPKTRSFFVRSKTFFRQHPKSIIFAGGSIIILILGLTILFRPINLDPSSKWDSSSLIEGTAATYQISNTIKTTFGEYTPNILSYTPRNVHVSIQPGLTNVDMQGLTIEDAEVLKNLEQYGFVLVDEGYKNIYEIYDTDQNVGNRHVPKFVTTDLCLHAYHTLYDISLRLLEGIYFAQNFPTMLQTLRTQQIALQGTVTEASVHDALVKNIAYLSVMLYLLDNSTAIPSNVQDLVNSELLNINTGVSNTSAIFGYEEDYSQYIVRGHYTRNMVLANYFRAMMYAGRMGFLLQPPSIGINHTRMALLLISSFNATIGSKTVWDYWDQIYQPTTFYVGASDDLTAPEYYQIWKKYANPQGDQLADDNLIQQIINEVKTYRKPQINSMFVVSDYENATQGFKLMGQRFIPDSYIFQQLVYDKVQYRGFPSGLDVFSVFGSPRADFHLQTENQTYPDYNTQITKLRTQFGNLTDADWTQNLYWSWLYALFPLLKPATDGYPKFMLSNAWTDKALMTALGSWTELRHDTILYAKQSYTLASAYLGKPKGYIEPYPEVYTRLGSLVRLLKDGLDTRGLILEAFNDDRYNRLDQLAEVFDRLTEISIKELENQPLSEQDISFIEDVGDKIESITSYTNFSSYLNEADDRMAVIADVHTDPNSGEVLEVGVGNPYVIYVIVQDPWGNLRLTKGGTFSYYEFKHPMNERLTDEEWHNMLDSNNAPAVPEWIQESLPINSSRVKRKSIMQTIARKEEN